MPKIMDLHVRLTRGLVEKYECCPNPNTNFVDKSHKILNALLDFDFIDSRKRPKKPPQDTDQKKRNLNQGPTTSEIKITDIISDESGERDTSLIDLWAEDLLVELNKSQEGTEPNCTEPDGADMLMNDADFDEVFSISQP